MSAISAIGGSLELVEIIRLRPRFHRLQFGDAQIYLVDQVARIAVDAPVRGIAWLLAAIIHKVIKLQE